MDKLKAQLKEVRPADQAIKQAALVKWDSLAKPLGSLGQLEQAIAKIAGLTGQVEVSLSSRALLVFCADNGVVAQGVTQTDSSVTGAVARALADGTSTVCHMAAVAHCPVTAVDVGMLDFPGYKGVVDRRVRNGTSDISVGPAMTREECLGTICVGMDLAREYKLAGCDILTAGEMGIGNTTTSSAVVSALLGLPPSVVTGRGAGLSLAGLERKVEVVQRAIAVNTPDPADPVDVLAKVGGLDLVALCGLYLGCAYERLPIILDGFISGTAALCAARLCPDVTDALIAGHLSTEPAGRMVLEELGLEPLISAGMHLGEGSGAVAALPLLDMALAVYHGGQSFEKLGIDAYRPQE